MGVAGVAPESRVLPLRILDDEGSGRLSDILEAFEFVRQQDVRVVNASFGAQGADDFERAAIAAADKTLFVVAAGNSNVNNDSRSAFYPCAYDLPNVLCVGASDRNDAKAGFSNYGANTVDVFAPGVDILSTTNDGGSTSRAGPRCRPTWRAQPGYASPGPELVTAARRPSSARCTATRPPHRTPCSTATTSPSPGDRRSDRDGVVDELDNCLRRRRTRIRSRQSRRRGGAVDGPATPRPGRRRRHRLTTARMRRRSVRHQGGLDGDAWTTRRRRRRADTPTTAYGDNRTGGRAGCRDQDSDRDARLPSRHGVPQTTATRHAEYAGRSTTDASASATLRCRPGRRRRRSATMPTTSATRRSTTAGCADVVHRPTPTATVRRRRATRRRVTTMPTRDGRSRSTARNRDDETLGAVAPRSTCAPADGAWRRPPGRSRADAAATTATSQVAPQARHASRAGLDLQRRRQRHLGLQDLPRA